MKYIQVTKENLEKEHIDAILTRISKKSISFCDTL